MPDFGAFHSQIVHFVVVGGLLGLPLYWLAFIRKLRALRLTGTILLVVATLAAWGAVASGGPAHEMAALIPGVAAAVPAHRDLGEDTRNLLTGVLLLELIALALAWRAARPRSSLMDVALGEPDPPRASALTLAAVIVRVGVGITWAFAAIILFEAAQRGGDLVFDSPGGIGVRGGQTSDVERRVIAGLYEQSRVDRREGDHEGAARLVRDIVRLQPDSPVARLLWVESLLEDRKDGRGALAALDSVSTQDPVLRRRAALSRASAYRMLGMPDSARAALDSVPGRLRRPDLVERDLKGPGSTGS